jgi:nucleotide-binding universal stress UspA family protein
MAEVREVVMFQRLLVPTDLTEATQRAIDVALGLASPRGAQIGLLHVIERIPNLDDSEMRTFYDRLERDAQARMRELSAKAGVSGDVEVVPYVVLGRRADEIVRFAEAGGTDLIILQHESDRGALLGSIAYKVSILAPCSVLILK